MPRSCVPAKPPEIIAAARKVAVVTVRAQIKALLAKAGAQRQIERDLRTNPSCILDEELRLVPLAREGSRTHVFEWRRDSQPDVYGQYTLHTAVVYFDFEPFDAPAVVNGKPSSTPTVAPTMRRDSHIARGPYHKLRN